MPLIENKLWGVEDKVEIAIARLREFEPAEGYYLAFSGGKDSQCIYHLAKLAGVKYDAHYNLTTVDPPELVYFIREHYPDVEVHLPDKTMWTLIVENGMPPTQLVRYCCRELKERGGQGRVTVTGVRWQESSKRKKRSMSETCYMDGTKTYLHPIIDWTSDDVWQFIKERLQIPYCQLYDEGYTRLGCVGCPMSNTKGMEKDFKRWPKIRQAYVKAFGRMVAERKRKGLDSKVNWHTGEDVMRWWIKRKEKQTDQTVLFE